MKIKLTATMIENVGEVDAGICSGEDLVSNVVTPEEAMQLRDGSIKGVCSSFARGLKIAHFNRTVIFVEVQGDHSTGDRHSAQLSIGEPVGGTRISINLDMLLV